MNELDRFHGDTLLPAYTGEGVEGKKRGNKIQSNERVKRGRLAGARAGKGDLKEIKGASSKDEKKLTFGNPRDPGYGSSQLQ